MEACARKSMPFAGKATSALLQCHSRPNALAKRAPLVQQSPLRGDSIKTASHNKRAELQLGWPGDEPFYNQGEAQSSGRFDILGLGQAMIDFQATADADFLERNGVEKGARR